MDSTTPPESRLLPPDPLAIRRALGAVRRPPRRGLPLLAIAVAAGIGASFSGGHAEGVTIESTPITGLYEVQAIASLAEAREAEAVVVARFAAPADVAATLADRRDGAQRALARWLAERRPSAIVDPTERGALGIALTAALFPDGEGTVDSVAVRSLHFR